MVIARIREHVAAHNWFAVLVDVAIVVLGVFFGTQVSNWNADRLESRQAGEYRRRLLQELDFNARAYAAQAKYYGEVIPFGDKVMNALDRPSADNSSFIVDAYQLTQIDQAPAKDYIYQELVSGGFVAGLGSEAIQNLVSDYYLNVAIANDLIGRTMPYRDLIRGVVPQDWQAQIEKDCGDRPVMSGGRLVGLTLVSECSVRFPPAQAAEVAQEIRAMPEIRTLTTRNASFAREKLALLDYNREQSEALIRALRRSGDRRP